MSCRSFPPFYEKEKDGVCVSTPPKIAPTSTKDYIMLFLLAAGFTGLILYAISNKSNPYLDKI
jgi:hypothetical protein